MVRVDRWRLRPAVGVVLGTKGVILRPALGGVVRTEIEVLTAERDDSLPTDVVAVARSIGLFTRHERDPFRLILDIEYQESIVEKGRTAEAGNTK